MPRKRRRQKIYHENITFSLPVPVVRDLREIAIETGVPMSTFVAAGIRSQIDVLLRYKDAKSGARGRGRRPTPDPETPQIPALYGNMRV